MKFEIIIRMKERFLSSSRMRSIAMLRIAHLAYITHTHHLLGEGGNGGVSRASLEHLDLVG